MLLLSEAQALEAHGHALGADRRLCARSLQEAHHSLERARADTEPEWIRYFDQAYLSARTGRALLDAGDSRQAAKAMRQSLSMESGFARGHAFNLAVLSRSLLDSGELDEGCTVARRALTAADGIKSARATGELRLVASGLAPYANAAIVRELLPALPALPSGQAGRGQRAAQ
jgi:hypothetical protein